MADVRTQRRLAAILAADVVGYSKMIRADEEGTLARLKALQAGLIDPKIAEHQGRIVKLMGDGILAEFPSVVDAVRAATEIQQGVAEWATGFQDDERLEFRIGINLGDVIIDGDDIHGDGVNVAARLEGIAEPGGICIAANVYDQVRDRMDLRFEDLGAHELKNIDRPVQVWQWTAKRAAAQTPASKDADTDAEKPTIAVLPFNNMSGDPEQEYFSDGITEDIITVLSKNHWFFVIARNTTFVFKGQAVDVSDVGKQLGARYVLEGSVRKAGNRVRVTAQLIDTATGSHLWAEKYDRELADIFAVQDEITHAIVGELTPQFLTAEVQRARRKTDAELDAWDLIMRGREHLWRVNREDNLKAQKFFEKAIARAGGSALGRSDLAMSYQWQLTFGWTEDPSQALQMMSNLAEQAAAADPDDAYALVAISFVKTYSGRFADGAEFGRRAIAANPNLALAQTALGFALIFSGEYGAGIEANELALRLSPRDPFMAGALASLALAYYLCERYEEAESVGRRLNLEQPDMPTGYRVRAASLAQLGRLDEAKPIVADHILRLIPGHTATDVGKQLPFGDNDEGRRHFLEGLVKAGLPE